MGQNKATRNLLDTPERKRPEQDADESQVDPGAAATRPVPLEDEMTIAKNTKRAKKAIQNARNIRCFSLSNNFSGQPLAEKPVVWGGEIVNNQHTKLVEVSQPEFLAYELAGSSKLTAGENGRYCIHVHSNLWYEFTAEV